MLSRGIAGRATPWAPASFRRNAVWIAAPWSPASFRGNTTWITSPRFQGGAARVTPQCSSPRPRRITPGIMSMRNPCLWWQAPRNWPITVPSIVRIRGITVIRWVWLITTTPMIRWAGSRIWLIMPVVWRIISTSTIRVRSILIRGTVWSTASVKGMGPTPATVRWIMSRAAKASPIWRVAGRTPRRVATRPTPHC